MRYTRIATAQPSAIQLSRLMIALLDFLGPPEPLAGGHIAHHQREEGNATRDVNDVDHSIRSISARRSRTRGCICARQHPSGRRVKVACEFWPPGIKVS